MEQATTNFGLKLDTTDLVFVGRDAIILVSAAVVDFESAGYPTAAVSVDLGLVYFSREVDVRFGDGIVGRRSPGFYAIRVSMNPSSAAHDPGITLLEIVGSTESEPLLFPVDLRSPSDRSTVTACLDLDPHTEGDTACLGWYGYAFTVSLCVEFVPVD